MRVRATERILTVWARLADPDGGSDGLVNSSEGQERAHSFRRGPFARADWTGSSAEFEKFEALMVAQGTPLMIGRAAPADWKGKSVLVTGPSDNRQFHAPTFALWENAMVPTQLGSIPRREVERMRSLSPHANDMADALAYASSQVNVPTQFLEHTSGQRVQISGPPRCNEPGCTSAPTAQSQRCALHSSADVEDAETSSESQG